MLPSRALTRLALGLTLVVSVPLAAGCGAGSQKSAASLPKPGPMPEFGDWTGVYFSATYGHLHLVREGDNLMGKWRTAAGEKWGSMHGKAEGDLFKYEWEETTIGMVGPSATRRGHGYFKYVTGENDEIRGEWGLNEDYKGVSWTAIKQKNQTPDPSSVVPDETQRVQGEGWDESGKKKQPAGEGEGDKKSEGWD